MWKQQLVWQDMSEAPKDREILVCIKFSDYIIRLDVVERTLRTGFEWYSAGKYSFRQPDNSPGESEYYNSDDFIGWSEVPVVS